MTYSNFTLSDLEEKFSVSNERKKLTFPADPGESTLWLEKELVETKEMSIAILLPNRMRSAYRFFTSSK
ncbi:MAG: hypothetical protein ACFCUI_13590 [Bernardetiaceae bacterium]